MKKVLVVFVLLAAFSAGAFAQLVLNGEFYTGLEVYIPRNYSSHETIRMNHVDHHKPEGTTLFNVTGTYTRDSFGLKLDTDFRDAAANFYTLNGAYGWASFFDSQIRVSMGKISDGVWVTSLENEYVLDELRGFRVELKPQFIEGLNVGAAFRAGESTAPDFDGEEFGYGMVLGASYITPVFNAVAAYDRSGSGTVIGGINYTGIYNLTDAGIEIRYGEFADWETIGYFTIDEKIGYRVMRPLTVSLRAAQTVYGDSKKDAALLFNPEVAYRLTPTLTAGLEAELDSPDYFTTANLAVVPYVDIALPGAAYIFFQYKMSLIDMKDPDHSIGVGLTVKAF
ncbi:MAG: hypothetical protein LBK40_08095, partial [Spirochaetaceae bacterium]|jgi:hypothetical protein|nr:hypothetical protein [Spirochaetaceae bacterium]